MVAYFHNIVCGVYSNVAEHADEELKEQGNPAYTNITVGVFISFMFFMATLHCCLACIERRRINRNLARIEPEEDEEEEEDEGDAADETDVDDVEGIDGGGGVFVLHLRAQPNHIMPRYLSRSASLPY